MAHGGRACTVPLQGHVQTFHSLQRRSVYVEVAMAVSLSVQPPVSKREYKINEAATVVLKVGNVGIAAHG